MTHNIVRETDAEKLSDVSKARYKILKWTPAIFRSLAICILVISIVASIVVSQINISSIEAAGTSITASSGSASAIQAAANTVYNRGGGTVYIPAGTYNLGGSVTIRNNTKLIGAGTGKTILRTSGTSQIIKVGGNNVRLSGFSLISPSYNGGNGIMVGNFIDFRIDHLRIEGYSKQAAIYIRGAIARGVIDHNWIKNKAASSLNYGVAVYGGNTWNKDMQLGTKYAVFIEDNTFINCRHAVASNLGSHYVFRYNLVQKGVYGQAVDAHGPAYSSNSVGSRAFEVYKNIIELPETSAIDKAICIRGGSGVIFGNIIRGYKYGIMFRIEDGQTLGAYPLYHQPHDVYIWGNSCNGRYNVGYANLYNTAYYIKQNRDWFAYARPGYTPYIYPHPLTR